MILGPRPLSNKSTFFPIKKGTYILTQNSQYGIQEGESLEAFGISKLCSDQNEPWLIIKLPLFNNNNDIRT